MPFFQDAKGVIIHDGEFKDIGGSMTTYDYSTHTHHENSHNTTNSTTTDSNNDSSTRDTRKMTGQYVREGQTIPVKSHQKKGSRAGFFPARATETTPEYEPTRDKSFTYDSGSKETKVFPPTKAPHQAGNEGGLERQSTQPPFPREASDPFPLSGSSTATWGSQNPFGALSTKSEPELPSNPFPWAQTSRVGEDRRRGGKGVSEPK